MATEVPRLVIEQLDTDERHHNNACEQEHRNLELQYQHTSVPTSVQVAQPGYLLLWSSTSPTFTASAFQQW